MTLTRGSTERKNQPGNKSRILFLRSYLEEHTDDDHYLTTEELIRIYSDHGYNATRQTISDDVAVLNASGVEILISHVRKNRTITNAYHIGARLFEIPELKLLVDAVSSSRFITAEKSDSLVQKISMLTNAENRDSLSARIYTADRLKTPNLGVLVNIDVICRAITNHHKIGFHYWDYNPSKHKVLKHNGEEYIASPYALVWNDDRYYAISYSDKHKKIINYRVDRMCDVEELIDSPAIEDECFNAAEYSKSMIKMYDDGLEEETVKLRCQNNLMKNVIDRFGEKILTEPIDNEHFTATISVAPSSTFFGWLVQYKGEIKIIEPVTVKKRYEETLESILCAQRQEPL